MNGSWNRWPDPTTDPEEREARRSRIKRGWTITCVVFTLVSFGVYDPTDPLAFMFLLGGTWVISGYMAWVHLIAVDDPDRADRINTAVTVAGLTYSAVRNHQSNAAYQQQEALDRAEAQRLAQARAQQAMLAHVEEQTRVLKEALRRAQER